jgi:O-antigen ligase
MNNICRTRRGFIEHTSGSWNHNQALWVLNSTGLVGGVFAFLAFLRIIYGIATEKWGGRHILLSALFVMVVVASLSLEVQHREIIWVLLALFVSHAKGNMPRPQPCGRDPY